MRLTGLPVGHTVPSLAVSVMTVVEELPHTARDGAVLVPRAALASALGEVRDKKIYLTAKPGQLAGLAEQVRGLTAHQPGAQARTLTEAEAELSQQVTGMLLVPGTVGGVIALVGLMNLISMIISSLMERRKELVVLRAMGAGRGQLLATTAIEAAALAVLGASLGCLGGVYFAWDVIRVLGGIPIVLPWTLMAAVVAGSGGVAALAAVAPALWAAQERLPAVLREL